MENFNLETPIPVINNTHIELRRIVKYKGELVEAKWISYIADITDLEASKTAGDDKNCTKVYTKNGMVRVRESYTRLKQTWLTWLEWAKTIETSE